MAQFNGTSGNDVHSGTADNDIIYGNAGHDELSGGAGDDYIDGGADDDFINGEAGNDHLIGGAGDDYITGGLGNDLITGGGGYDTLLGGGDDDSLSGGANDDVLYGDAGNDSLSGGDGNDFLRGGSGVDSYDGGADDGVNPISFASIYGDLVSFRDPLATQGAIADLRNGQIANDGFGNAETMTGIESFGAGTAFADQFYGNDGRNGVTGGRGDTVMMFAGDDALFVTGAPAVLDGGDGTDSLTLLLSGGLVPGNPGAPAQSAPAMTSGYVLDLQAQTLTDGHGFSGSIAGIERITGSDLDDVLRGSGADEWFASGRGSDTIDGRGGVDTLSYAADPYAYYFSFKGGIFVDLASGQVIETSSNRQIGPGSYPQEGRASPPGGTTGANATAEYTDTIAGIENVVGTGLGDTIYGNDGENRIAPGAGSDIVDGRGGIDTIDYSSARASVVVRLDQGTAVESGTGEIQFDHGVPNYFLGVVVEADDYSEKTDQLANIENAIGTAFADILVGDSGANRLDGGDGNDQLRSGAGTDSLHGGAGNDVLYFGAALSAGDVADGGEGRDAVVLQGNVTVVLSETNLVGIESISIQSGANATFGDTANNFYDYDVTTADGNVASGQQLIVNAQSLRAGEDFTFDGSAESDGKFLVYGGHGVDDLTGGAGADVFLFEGTRWGPGDKVDGGAGRDALVISAGSGLTHIEFAADALTGIESISLNNRYATDPSQKPSYELVLHNGNVAPGGTLIVNGSSIPAGQVVNIDGRGVHDGHLILFGGGGHDTLFGGDGNDLILGGAGADGLTGGAGADTFRYDAASDSTSGLYDLIGDFQTGIDKIDLSRIDANTHTEGNQAFSWIGSNAFSGTGAASAGELRLFEDGGYQRIEGDTNGDGNADFAIVFQLGTAPLVQGDFLL
jgi:Ca2+-binding RTX toxin-like protein